MPETMLLAQMLGLLLVIGAFAGVLAGLLGVGGGIVLVPAFFYAFQTLGYGGPQLMQLCLATSLATIVVTSVRSVLSHNKKGAVICTAPFNIKDSSVLLAPDRGQRWIFFLTGIFAGLGAAYDHVVNLVGIDHVGLGSDYDGVGDSLPTGLKDVSTYPNLIYELLQKGYSDEDIRKILGENALRVWSEVERIAQASQTH